MEFSIEFKEEVYSEMHTIFRAKSLDFDSHFSSI